MTLPDPDAGGGLAAPVYSYGYNAVGSMTTMTDALSNVTTIAYDNLQRRTSVTQPDPDAGGSLTAPVTSWTYGASTLVTAMDDPLGRDTTYGYDTYGRMATVTNHEGYVTTTAYNLLDQVTSVTTPDPDGAGNETASVTSYAYDYLNRLASSTDPLSGVTAFTYDLNNRLINLRDPVNNDTAWAYDNAGRVTMETNELSNTRSFWHDAAGNLTRKKDRNERVTQYTFDDLDRLTAEKWLASGDPVPTIAISTTTQGAAASEVQRAGFTVTGMGIMGGTFTLSFGGNTTSGIAHNASAATVQSALEGLASIGAGNVSVTKLQGTANAQEWQVTFQGTLAAANQSQATINSASVTYSGTKTDIQATDTNGQPATTDEVQVVTLSNATGGEFRLAYSGQTTAPIAYNASASTVETALEALQAIDQVTVTGSAGGPWTITFAGTHADTNVPQIQGDAANSSSGTISRTLSFSYNTGSQLTSASDTDGSLAFSYDNMGRVTSETQSVTGLTPTVVLATTYDANSNRLTLAATLGSNADFKNSYVYDNLSRMTRVTQASNGGNTIATKRVDFAYNALGQFTTIDRYQNTGGTNNVAQTTFAYDTLNRLTDLDHKQNTTTLAGYDYTYDRMNRLATITGTVEGLSTFTYDKTSQLTGGDHASGGAPDETYTFDANGNRTMTGHTTTTNNLTTSDGTYDYEYDDEGNRTKKTTISTGAYEEYTWDHRNRLTKVTFKDSSHTVTKTVEHQYDIFNRWTRRHTDPDGPGGAAARDNFFAYDGIEPILQLDGAADTDLTNRYLWGPAVDQIFADEQPTTLSSAGNIIWPLSDHLGTARDLADQNESTYTTTVANHRTYNAFGKLTAETNSAIDSDPSYTGKITDSDTNLQNNVNRWYDAVLGQWASEDPIAFSAGDQNLKRYVSNEPLLFLDSFGLQSGRFAFPRMPRMPRMPRAPLPRAPLPKAPGPAPGPRAPGPRPLPPPAPRPGTPGGPGVPRPGTPGGPGTGSSSPRPIPQPKKPPSGEPPDPTAARHKKKRPSTREDHEEGDTRRERDKGGEKGDEQRKKFPGGYPRKRPKGWPGKYPPPPDTGIYMESMGTYSLAVYSIAPMYAKTVLSVGTHGPTTGVPMNTIPVYS